MSDIPIQPAAPIPREQLCSEERNSKFIYPCGGRQCTWKPGAEMKTSPHVVKPIAEKPKILPNILHTIGNTPLVRLNNIPKSFGIKCEMLAKCEFLNPTGSVKDRIALNMVLDAEQKGLLKPGDILIEPTAGNTGLSLAMVSKIKGYQGVCVMASRMSTDKVDAIKAFGVKVVRTPPGDLGTQNCIFNVSQTLCRETPNSLILDQFRNSSNPLAHYETTAEEILHQCDGKVDAIVCGAGTGGTITGIARKMKEKCPSCKVIGADPYGSVIAEPSELNETSSKIIEMEGIGLPFVPTTLDRSIISKWCKISDKDSNLMARRLIAEEGIPCGGSSGTAMCAALEVAKTMSEGQRLVVILPDSCRNYMTKFLSDPWMKIRNYIGIDDENRWWWSQLPVKVLCLRTPQCISHTTTCSAAVQIMSKKSQNYIFVEKEGEIIGSITSSKILTDIMELKHSFDIAVENIVNSVRTVDDETPLGKVCAIIQLETFVLLKSTTNQGIGKKTETVIKYATSNDLLAYISCNEPK